MGRRSSAWILCAIVALHLCLAVWYATVTPYRTPGAVLMTRAKVQDVGAPDERQHVNYVGRLAAGDGFPVFNPSDPNLYEDYQSHQPPAYYLLAAGWSKFTAAGDLNSRSSGMKLRFLSALLTGGTVLGAFFLGLWGFGRKDVGLVAAAFVALLPMFVALGGAVSNDPMLICLCTWTLAVLAYGVRRGFNWKLAAGIGVLTGTAFLTKTTAIALAPALLTAIALPQTKKASFAMIALAVIIALVLAGPWWVRNQRLYGDPLAMTAFNQAFKGSAQRTDIVRGIAAGGDSSPELAYWKDWVGWWSARSFFGAFGYMDIWLNEKGTAMGQTPNTLYRLLIIGMLIAFTGWALALKKGEWKESQTVQIVNGVFLVVILGLFIRFNMQYFQAQARYVLPALGPISCGVAVGLLALFEKRRELALALIAVILLGVNIYALNLLPDQFQKRVEAGRAL